MHPNEAGRTGVRERELLLRELRARLGRQVAELRSEAGVTRAELARCADIHRAHLGRIEEGKRSPSFATMIALSSCLGADFSVRLFPTAGPRLHDRFQAPMIEALIQRLGPPWRAQPEVAVPAARGVIDLVLTRALDSLAIACECHSEVRRLEQVLRRAAEKADGLRTSGDAKSTVSSLLLLRSTLSTRALAKAYASTFTAAYPARCRDALDALSGNVAWPGAAILWATVERGRAVILDEPPRGVRFGR
jgi:transcriptional regulator with XRE-family HTH domain